jgi:hypothetical protein
MYRMEKFWSIFWKFFSASLVLAIITGIIISFVFHSTGTAYVVVQGAFAMGLGICGLAAFIVIPVQMFVEDRTQSGGTEDAAE